MPVATLAEEFSVNTNFKQDFNNFFDYLLHILKTLKTVGNFFQTVFFATYTSLLSSVFQKEAIDRNSNM